ncbi:hypothetical protein FDO65_17500 [Nakamurella flava]|uniref:Serine kinase n=1 Tax=Nakamurella flava TaxID=2576308 RepID=A0A4U6QBM7_9ACTN|nr:hypothetical protein [Nakamurella flava]TKV57322.1 hypothetical protein FDO65_17500 [Nakamurella flava]
MREQLITGPNDGGPDVDAVGVAHGLRIEGLDAADNLPRLPAGQAADLPVVRVERTTSPCPTERRVGAHGCGGDVVVREFSGDRVLVLDRLAGTATFHGPATAPDVFVHPGLLMVSAQFNHWAGRETFQAGAFTVGGRAYLIAGPSDAGKSVLLTALAAAGATVLTDGGAVTDGRSVFSGPRTLDLSEPVPMHVVGLPMQPANGQTRCRFPLGPAPLRRPLAGVFFLRWGGPVRAEPVSDAGRAGRLAAQRTLRVLLADPGIMTAIAALPAWNVHRAREWSSLDETVDLVLGLARSTGDGTASLPAQQTAAPAQMIPAVA